MREGDRSTVSNERVDLGGRCVVPGFTDAHVHFLEWALSLDRLDLSGTRSHAEVLAAAARCGGWSGRLAGGRRLAVGALARRRPGAAPGGARRGLRGSPGAALGARSPHRSGCRRRRSRCCRSATSPVVERDAAGEPTGVLRETAAWEAAAAIPQPAERELDEALVRGTARGARARSDGHPRLPARMGPGRVAAPARRPPPVAARLGLAAGRATRRDHRARAAQRARRRLAAHRPRQGVRRRHARLAHRVDARAVRRRGARRGAAERGRAARPRRRSAPTRDSSSRCTPSAMRPTGPCWTPSRRRASAGLRGVCGRASSTRSCCTPMTSRASPTLGVTASMQPSHAPSDRSLAEAVWGARCAGAYALGSLSRERSRAVLRLRRADRAARPAGRRPGRRHARLAGLRGARGRARAGRLLERRRPRTPGRAPPRAGCCRASRPTSSCSSAIPSPARRTRSPGSASSRR